MTQVDSFRLIRLAAGIADEKKGLNIQAIDVRKLSSVAEGFLFVGGNSHIHVKAMEDSIRDELKKAGADLKRTDGQRGHGWRVLDYGDFIVHLMEEATREFYSIERLWNQGKPIPLSKKAAPKKPRKKRATKKKVSTKTKKRKTKAKKK